MTPPSRRDRNSSPVHGVVVVDKPQGPTSHDMVDLARRALGTRTVGHTGTLDPMATGVVVLVIGEARKLAQYLTAGEKVYDATIALGSETDTLDAEGKVIAETAVPAGLTVEQAAAAAKAFVGKIQQKPPALSAIKLDGVALYRRFRRGEVVDPAAREVFVRSLEVLEASSESLRVRVVCGKGFYARSLARDLALALGTRGHLSALRRLRSGEFSVEDAVDGALLAEAQRSDEARRRLLESVVPLLEACAPMPRVVLSDHGVFLARRGQLIPQNDTLPGSAVWVDSGVPVALASSRGRLIAIGKRQGPFFRVLRGFQEIVPADLPRPVADV
jgi:tRNA pseudouridine55 synthase